MSRPRREPRDARAMAENEHVRIVEDDPISWRAAHPGAEVYGSDGAPAGTLRSVEGDAAADIFHGIVVDADGREVLVPASHVATITEGRVDVTMPAPEVAALEEWSAAGASAAPAGERDTSGSPGPPAI